MKLIFITIVRYIASDEDDRNIVSTIINMSENLGMVTIAEGVETQAQLDFLIKQGCDEIQGYYFSKPLPVDEFTLFLKNWNS